MKTFLCLRYKGGIILKGSKGEGIINVSDTETFLCQHFSPQHILVAIMSEPLIKGMRKHHLTVYEEVGGMEVTIGMQQALIDMMRCLTMTFILVTEVMPQPSTISPDDIATIDQCTLCIEIFAEKIIPANGHITVNKEQPVVMSLTDEEIPNGGPSLVLFPPNILGMRKNRQSVKTPYNVLIRRAIVTDKHLNRQSVDQLSLCQQIMDE